MRIITFGAIILMMSANSREHMTIVGRMREYYCLWHGYFNNKCNMALYTACASIVAFGLVILMVSAITREHMTIVRRMREFYCLRHGASNDKCCMA